MTKQAQNPSFIILNLVLGLDLAFGLCHLDFYYFNYNKFLQIHKIIFDFLVVILISDF